MVARRVTAFSALVALAACNRINPYYEGPGGETWDDSGGTDGNSGSASSGATGSSGDDGGTGGTGGGSSSGDDGGSSGTGGSSGNTGSSGTTSADVWQYLPLSQDAWIRQQFPDENHGQDQDLRAGSGSTYDRANRLLVQFDMDPLKPDCNFSEAILMLYYYEDGMPEWANVDVNLRANPLSQNWTENGVTWNTYDGNAPWTAAGGDYHANMVCESAIVGGQYGWASWHVNGTVRGWCQGTLANHGLIVREDPDDGAGLGRKLFFSREYAADPDLRPLLLVQLAG